LQTPRRQVTSKASSKTYLPLTTTETVMLSFYQSMFRITAETDRIDQALLYYKAMRGLQRKAKAGIIDDCQKAILYDAHKAGELLLEMILQRHDLTRRHHFFRELQGVRSDNARHDDGRGEIYLDE
jgi:hypothetical protein